MMFGSSITPAGGWGAPALGFGSAGTSAGGHAAPVAGSSGTGTPGAAAAAGIGGLFAPAPGWGGGLAAASGGALAPPRTGTCHTPYTVTHVTEYNGVILSLPSLVAMPAYRGSSPEELRAEDYAAGVRGGAGHAGGTGDGAPGARRPGTAHTPYAVTCETDDDGGVVPLASLVAMPAYRRASPEELRAEDYAAGVRGGPGLAAAGGGAATPAPSGGAHGPAASSPPRPGGARAAAAAAGGGGSPLSPPPACVICLEPLAGPSSPGGGAPPVKALPCAPAFHEPCVAPWPANPPPCPLCPFPV